MWKRLKRWWEGRGHGACRELSRVCLGDAEKAERLIAYEQAQAPTISRTEACRRAVARHRRDS